MREYRKRISGYLSSREDNTALRNQTVRSHVQVKRDFSVGDMPSPELKRVYRLLCQGRDALWDNNIPEMVLAYFCDMQMVLRQVRKPRCWTISSAILPASLPTRW